MVLDPKELQILSLQGSAVRHNVPATFLSSMWMNAMCLLNFGFLQISFQSCLSQYACAETLVDKCWLLALCASAMPGRLYAGIILSMDSLHSAPSKSQCVFHILSWHNAGLKQMNDNIF